MRSIAHGVSPIRDQSKTALVLLLAGTALLLVMVCANVGGLLLSRAAAHSRETAVRVALGADRVRLLLTWVIQSLLLVATGGAAGVMIAVASMPAVMRLMPPAHGIGFDVAENRTLALNPQIDFRVAAFTLAACLVTAVLCAVAPALRFSRDDINLGLRGGTSDRRHRLFECILCGLQVALCTALLVCSGLIIRSLSNLRTANAGFDGTHVAVFSIDPHVRGYDSRATWSVQQRVVKAVTQLPEVQGAALAGRALMRGIGLGNSVVLPGQQGDGIVNTGVNSVTPGYFRVMGIRFVAGRDFLESEQVEEGKVTKVIVNVSFAQRFLGGQDPLGKQFGTGKIFQKPQYEVIGVVSDTKYRSMREVPPPIFYTYDFGPKAYPDTFVLHVRTAGDPRGVIAPVQQLLKTIDPELPVYQVATISGDIDRSLWQEPLLVILVSCFSIFSLFLSAIGLYGVLAFFVTRRRREIGIRMALGADVRQVVGLVVGRVGPTLVLGVIVGLALSLFAGVVGRSLLYGVAPFDLFSVFAALLLVLVIGAAGAAAPAFRAIRLDPASTLREE